MTSASSLGLSSSITRPCATPTHGSQLRSPRGSGPLGPSVLQGPGPSKALAATLRPSRRPRRGMSRRLLRADAMAGPGTSRWLQRSGGWAQAASYGGWDRRGEGGHHGYDGGWWTDVQSASSTSAWTWDAWAAEWHGDGLRLRGEMMADIQSQAGHPPLEAQEVAADEWDSIGRSWDHWTPAVEPDMALNVAGHGGPTQSATAATGEDPGNLGTPLSIGSRIWWESHGGDDGGHTWPESAWAASDWQEQWYGPEVQTGLALVQIPVLPAEERAVDSPLSQPTSDVEAWWDGTPPEQYPWQETHGSTKVSSAAGEGDNSDGETLQAEAQQPAQEAPPPTTKAGDVDRLRRAHEGAMRHFRRGELEPESEGEGALSEKSWTLLDCDLAAGTAVFDPTTKGVTCTVCDNKPLNSRSQYVDHREGKRHKKRVAAEEKKKLELTVAPYQ